MSSPKTLVFCSCSEAISSAELKTNTTIELDSLPSTIFHDDTVHPLSYLNFCDHCKAVKCRRCTELEIVSKFCPKCMVEMRPDQNLCSRNCFDCPLCDSHVVIHQKSTSVKNYKLKCTKCTWNWETGDLDKPKSLARVVKSKQNDEFVQHSNQFIALGEFYIQRRQLELNQIDISKEVVIKFKNLQAKEGLKDNDIYDFIRENTIKSWSETEDELSSRSSISDNSSITPYDQVQKLPYHQESHIDKLYPRSTRLRTKTSKRCKACRTSLMKPESDPKSTKFYKLSNAIDVIPTFKLHKNPKTLDHNPPLISGSKHTLLLSISNPMETQSKVTVSTYSTVPGNHPHRVNIPVSSVTLGARPENFAKLEGYIKTIPTFQLTKNTKMARVELMNRETPNFRDDGIIERGVNYIVIPINITLDTSLEKHVLKIPLFVTLEADKFSYGFWVILGLGEINSDTPGS